MSTAREEILATVGAVRFAPQAAVPHAYRRRGTMTQEERTARFCERVGDYRAEVHVVTAAAEQVAAVCDARGVTTLAVPAGLPPEWRPAGVDLVDDERLSWHELDSVGGALTGCTVAIAETGTIVLAGAAHEGRRALTLIPDLHVCVVREPQIVELLPEALDRLDAAGLADRPLTFVSGPSATSDIELSRVEGVHGPRQLVVLVLKESR